MMLNCSLLSTELVYAACIILCIELCSMCQLYTEAVQWDMGWYCSMGGSSSECSFGKVRMTSMQGTIYLLGTKCHMVSTQTAPAALHMGMLLHIIYGKTIPTRAPRKPFTLIMHLDRTRMYRADQCEGLQVVKEKKHG